MVKIDNSALFLQYCGYIGGTDSESGQDVVVDAGGNALVVGTTGSSETSFPVAIGPDITHNGVQDAFVAKVNPSGGALVSCGYIGGVDADFGFGIDLDNLNNVYVGGITSSNESSFPVTNGPDGTHNGGQDAFTARVKSNGTGLDYCGYVGGSGDDQAWGLAVAPDGDAVITGTTTSSEATFPVAVGPDLTYNSGNKDIFVARISTSCCITRGDVDHNGGVNVADVTYLVNYLFKGGPAPPCMEEADVNASGGNPNVADLTYLVDYLFKAGPAPPPC